MLEKNIVNKILKYLKSLDGCFCFKHNGLTAGIPDIICCYKGRFFAFEVKNETGRVTNLQKAIIEKLNRAGGVAVVVRSVDEVKLIIGGVSDEC
jgi:Holliday junction resolvase